MKRFLKGFSYNFTGYQYFKANRDLWKFVLIPFVINFLALVLLVSLYLNYFNDLFVFITSPLSALDIANPQGFLLKMADIGLWALSGLFKVVFFILSFVLIFIAVFLLSSLINSPFYEAMAEKILMQKGLLEDRPFQIKRFMGEIVHSLKIELLKILFFIAVSFVLFLLGWVPVVGPIFSLLAFLFASWVFAMGLSTYPMVLQKSSFREILNWAKQKKMMLIGFGIPSMIPFLGLLIMNFQVVGGTLIYVEFCEKVEV